jgi:hypothetical protein
MTMGYNPVTERPADDGRWMAGATVGTLKNWPSSIRAGWKAE